MFYYYPAFSGANMTHVSAITPAPVPSLNANPQPVYLQ